MTLKKLKIKKGDEVAITTGKDRGKKGKVIKVYPKECKVVVSGINLVTKHSKPSQNDYGGISYKEMPIHISNVSHIDPKTNTNTKIGFKFLQGDNSIKKVRFAKKSGEIIDK